MAMTVPQMALPEVLPVFPLTGVMLLPGTVLPLHIFEPRYRAMVEDALDGDKMFGMIQPFTPQSDNRGPRPARKTLRRIYTKSDASATSRSGRNLPDGRFFVQLKGVNRFRLSEEIALHRGYRRVKAVYQEFPDAILQQSWQCDRPARARSAGTYGKAHGMEVKAGAGGEVFRPGIGESSRSIVAVSSGGKTSAAGSAQRLKDRRKNADRICSASARPSEPIG